MSACVSVKLSPGQKIALYRRVEAKLASPLVAAGRCDACNKMLEESEATIRGYASGVQMGLCRRCASYVNTEQAIGYAESIGAKVYCRPVVLTNQENEECSFSE